ncbi:unnamed protein product [Mycena citricolor]|uniref:Uncharacterized protein n=1 Tax=Mycena citricolor TaxID=2018698 RepID=A0AAD2H9H8_9AGAR|nr:unnamed protein product [Mycena citricolor]
MVQEARLVASLSPLAAFYEQYQKVGLPPAAFGQKNITWPLILRQIKRPALCWPYWAPERTVDKYSTVANIWDVYVAGEPKMDADGKQTGMKPPLQLVEQEFGERWRSGPDLPGDKKTKAAARKSWERFREIPEWIDSQAKRRSISPSTVIDELEALRSFTLRDGITETKMGLNQLSKRVKSMRLDGLKSFPSFTTPPSELETASSPLLVPLPSTSSLLDPPIDLVVQTTAKRRAPAIGARTRPAKKAKVSQFDASDSDTPFARMLSGKISPVMTHATGPQEVAKNAM